MKTSKEEEPVDFATSLFEAIKHGDQEHQTWLKEAIDKWVDTNLTFGGEVDENGNNIKEN